MPSATSWSRALPAGLEPTEVHPLTRRVLEEVGIDTGNPYAKGVDAFLGKVNVRLAIVVCARDQESCPRVFPFASRTLYWPFDDPAEATGTPEQRLAVFRRVRDEIASRVGRFVLEGV